MKSTVRRELKSYDNLFKYHLMSSMTICEAVRGILFRDARRRLALVVLLPVFGVVFILTFLICLIRTSSINKAWLFSNVPIRGGFTQIQAKAIDFAVGALLAPIAIASANFLWFDMSRVACFNEKCNGPNAVSLQALTEVATTSSGSYNVLKHFALIKTYQSRLFLLSILVLSSALSSTLLSNAIAYEAYREEASPKPVVMQSLDYNGNLRRDNYEPLLFLINTINTLTFENATSLLYKDHSFVAANLTKASVTNSSASIVALKDVAAYRVTIDCKPAEINEFNFSSETLPHPYLNSAIRIGEDIFSAYIPGNFKVIAKDNPKNFYDMIAFNMKTDESWVLFNPKILLVTATRSGNPRVDTPGSSPSSFGNLSHYTFETNFGDTANQNTTMEAWGIVCERNWQMGTLDMTRNQTSNTWSFSRLSFSDPFVNPFSWLPLIELPPTWRPPWVSFGGIGAALGASSATESKGCPSFGSGCTPDSMLPGPKRTLNFTTFAHNYLYLSASLDNRIFNVDLCSGLCPKPDRDVVVRAVTEILAYRVTYIPGILIFALVAVVTASAIPLAMLLHAGDTIVLRKWRVLSPLRLVFDCAAAFGKEDSLSAVEDLRLRKLRALAENMAVGYHVVDEGSGSRVALRLESMSYRRGGAIQRESGDGASQHLLESIDGDGSDATQ